MRWEDRLRDVFEDLEQQAEGLHLSERDAEVVDRSRAEYTQVTMASRLHASIGSTLTLRILGVGHLQGMLMRVGSDWLLVRADPTGQEWIVSMPAVRDVRGLSTHAVSEPARSALTRLGLGSALRGVAETGATAVFEHVDGTQQRGALVRVGKDFVQIRRAEETGAPTLGDERDCHVLPFGTLAAVRRT